jgi:large subunit ribosomal protein L22
MESVTYLKNLRIAPKKLRFFMPEIKKLKPVLALDYLFYIQNKPAKIFYKAIKSAVTNAKNTLKVNEDLLKFKVLTIEEGQKLKRYRPGSRGTAKPFKRRMSHIKIILQAQNIAKKIGVKNLKDKARK